MGWLLLVGCCGLVNIGLLCLGYCGLLAMSRCNSVAVGSLPWVGSCELTLWLGLIVNKHKKLEKKFAKYGT